MSRTAALLISAAAAASLAVGVPTAGATTITQPNACSSSTEAQYGDLPLRLTGTGTQNGRQFDVGAIQPQVDVPSWLPEKIKPYLGAIAVVTGTGKKTINLSAWAAITGKGSTEGTQVVTTTGTAQVTIAGDIFNGYRISNISLSLSPTGATTWHAPDAGGPIEISQGAAGTLPAIPAGDKGAMVTPKGSLYIRGSYSNVFSLLIDCQPGKTDGDGTELRPAFSPLVPIPALSSTFDAVKAVVPPVEVPAATQPGVSQPVVNSPATPAPASAPAPAKSAPAATPSKPLAAGTLAIASAALKFGSAAVLVNVSCPAGGPDCTGSATMTSAKKLKVGKGAAKVRKLAAGTYSVPAGTTAPVKLKLAADGKKLRKTALVATVALKPTSGTAITKSLRANG